MLRYIVSLIVFFAGLIASILGFGYRGSIGFFLDLPSFIISVILPFLFVSILFGFKETGQSFSTAFKKEANNAQLLMALNFFKAFGKAVWITSITVVIIGIILLLKEEYDASVFSINLAVALIPVLYGAIISIVIIVPFTVFIEKRL